MTWRKMTEHWDVQHVIVLAFFDEDPNDIDVFRCRVGEHGALFNHNGDMISLHERGWVPFAWREDDTPARDNDEWPPMWADYLTEEYLTEDDGLAEADAASSAGRGFGPHK